MTKDEIIAMAIKAGLAFDSEEYPEIWGVYMDVGREEIMSFAKLVATHERERCCFIVYSQCDSDNVAQRTVDAIRGQQ